MGNGLDDTALALTVGVSTAVHFGTLVERIGWGLYIGSTTHTVSVGLSSSGG